MEKKFYLPIMRYNEETDEAYYYMNTRLNYVNEEERFEELKYRNLSNALEELTYAGFYYPFNALTRDEKGNLLVGHCHTHDFEGVVQELYFNPESFSIPVEDEEYYSKQELKYLREIQAYLQFIGLKDVRDFTKKNEEKRLSNTRIKEIIDCDYCKSEHAAKLVSGKIKYDAQAYFRSMKLKKTKLLVRDINNKFLGIVEKIPKEISLDEIDKYDIDYKGLGFKTLKEYKDTIASDVDRFNHVGEVYDPNRAIVILNKYKVVKKFK
jgi:hypothetical protein